MAWNSPAQSRWMLAAAVLVFAVSFAVNPKDGPVSPRSGPVAAAGLRDAVASPAMPMGPTGWFQAAGLAGLGRAAHGPAALGRGPEVLPLRASSGRKAFLAARVVVDRVVPGIPEPTLAAR